MNEVVDKSIVLFDFKFTEPYSCDTHFVITIGDRTYESDLSDWTNDFNSIRLSIEHKILTPYMKQDIELYFEDSPTIIKSYCRNWETRGTKVTIIPNEYVQVPNLEGWCDFRQFICSLYLGLLSICMQDTDWFDAGTEGGTWECFRLATYNKLQSCLIEDFVKGISVSDFENRPRQRFITSVKEMIADYEQLKQELSL